MAYNNRKSKPWMRREPLQKTRNCSCGGIAKLSSRMNYPFGKKSKGVKTMDYVCKTCRNRYIFSNGKGGR